jgi:hypothetical protein
MTTKRQIMSSERRRQPYQEVAAALDPEAA